jgi:hypothetical protein
MHHNRATADRQTAANFHMPRGTVGSSFYIKGKGRRTPPDASFVTTGRKLPKSLRASLRRTNQALPRGIGSGGFVKHRTPSKAVNLNAALGGNGEVERSKSVNERLNNLILLPCQRVPVVEATMAELRG